jgi:hypothetical protein
MHLRRIRDKLVASLLILVGTLPFCLLGICLAFVASINLFGLTADQLQQPASFAWMATFGLLVCLFVTLLGLVGYGLLILMLRLLSASKLLLLVGPQDQGHDPLSLMSRWVYQLAVRCGSPSGI